jgi:predicted ribosomally synthesized peptide with SipW-like signal peptide
MFKNWKFWLGIVAVAVMIFGTIGSGAWFSDQGKSTGNTVTAGTLNMTVDGQDSSAVRSYSVSNIYPSNPWSHSWGHQWIVTNVGTLPGKLSISVSNLQNFENGCNAPETAAGDTTCGTGPDQGELGQLMYGKIGPNNYDAGYVFNNTPWSSPVFNPLNTMNNTTTDTVVLQPGESVAVYFDLEFDTHPGLTDNLAQGDGISFDVTFDLVQVH